MPVARCSQVHFLFLWPIDDELTVKHGKPLVWDQGNL